ncbi:MAG: hypothetical protein H7249_15965 [Chitinophagaceae bacterium]|nr:hypothetical protein [Oligoflexus sp.]
MEVPEIIHQAKVYSQSPLHYFITGPELKSHAPRSQMNPYRRRQGLMALLGLQEVMDELKKDDEKGFKTLPGRPLTDEI